MDMVRMMQLTFAASLTIALVSNAPGPVQAAEKARRGGAVAVESLTIAHEGMKGKKPSRLKAKNDQRKGDLGSWSKVDGLDVTWKAPSAGGSSKGKKAKK
jgi:hypothetical protein